MLDCVQRVAALNDIWSSSERNGMKQIILERKANVKIRYREHKWILSAEPSVPSAFRVFLGFFY